ncbi:tumor necrosis factor receptor superfamily member 6B-like [Carassius gibelio]|uniref:tumor necrosis factor receptor superfamily member 6B-like n=1 Tax=Carassius gibelio TaxID=101364 RepID=UPI0022777DF5|nr:tumor necrosis factor receptor superfamily member 6B-like [Carassius gibelio]
MRLMKPDSSSCDAGLAADEPTYRRTYPATRQQLRCKRCPPGTRLGAHCTSSSETDCVPCGPGMFTEFWNYIPECLRCDACSDHQRVVRPCNGTVNTVCECDAGFYWNQRFCRRHSECKPGHGLKASECQSHTEGIKGYLTKKESDGELRQMTWPPVTGPEPNRDGLGVSWTADRRQKGQQVLSISRGTPSRLLEDHFR